MAPQVLIRRRLALVDADTKAHETLRQALWIKIEWTMESYTDFAQAQRATTSAPPHALLMGTNPAGIPCIRCLRELKASLPPLPVAMFTPRPQCDTVLLALKAGANGYLVRPISQTHLLQALDRLAAGRLALCDVAQDLLAEGLRASPGQEWLNRLTPREQQVVERLLRHDSDKAIAHALGITQATVHAHLNHIYAKLEVRGRAALRAKYSF